MPQKEQTITFYSTDVDSTLAICYEAFKNLGWQVLSAGNNNLVGYTLKKWNSNQQQITVSSESTQLSVTSKMIKGESMDVTGKNKKNIDTFIAALEEAKKSITPNIADNNKRSIEELRIETIKIAKQEAEDALELRTAMNLNGSNLYGTYVIMGINLLVFILMAINGAGIFIPDGLVNLKWGSNFAPLTLSGDWWRLITNLFIHFGIIHIVMNMYALYMIAIFLEPMLGKAKYIAAYLCTGIFGSLASLWWHNPPVNSAGASGAIFGLYGLFFALLTTNLIPAKARQQLLKSIGIFIVYNLVYGLKSGVDMSAHVGGIVSGFIIGYLYIYSIRKEKEGQKLSWVVPLVVIVTVVSAAGYLQQNKASADQRNEVLAELKDSNYKDVDKFNTKYNEFIQLQDTALAPFKDTSALLNEAFRTRLETESKPAWQNVTAITTEMKTYDIPDRLKNKIAVIDEYTQARENEIDLVEQIISYNKPEDTQKLDSLRTQLNGIVSELEKQ